MAAIALPLLCVAGSLYFQAGGFLEMEATTLFQYYLVDRPLLPKIFDVRRNDWGLYMARELSYAVSYLDAKFILASIRAGMAHFYPLSHYTAILTVVFLHLRWGRRYFTALPPWLLLLLALLYLTSSNSFFGVFFNSGKALVGVGLFATLWYAFVVSELHLPSPDREGANGFVRSLTRVCWSRVLLVFVLGLFTSLGDRQGFFYVVLLLAVSALLMLLLRSARYLILTLTFLAVVLANTLYNLVLGPHLVQITNGYEIDMKAQDILGIFETLKDPFGVALDSFVVVPDVVSYFFGNLGTAAGVLIMAGCVTVLATCADDSPRPRDANLSERLRRARYALVFLGCTIALCAASWTFTIMKSWYMLKPENRLVYYWVPFNAVVLFASAATLQLLLARRPAAKRPVLVVVAALLALNLYAIPGQYRSYLYPESSWQWHEQAPALLECLADLRVDQPVRGLNVNQAAACRMVRKHADPEAANPSTQPESDWRLARRYWLGDGVPRERSESISWLRRSAAAGYPPAIEELGLILLRRAKRAVPQPTPFLYEQADRQLLRAAELGSARAQRELGRIRTEGIGRPPEMTTGLTWLLLARESGDQQAADLLVSLEPGLGTQTRNEARQRAQQWRATHALDESFLTETNYSDPRAAARVR